MASIDVREDVRQGRPPIRRVTEALEQLAPGETLVIISPFEPIPLFAMMKANGFSNRCRKVGPAHWETVFTPDAVSQSGSSLKAGAERPEAPCGQAKAAEPIVEVDARGLEPPEPMIRILSALEELEEGGMLRGITERRPIHLLDALAERGYRAESFEDTTDGSWVTLIRRA